VISPVIAKALSWKQLEPANNDDGEAMENHAAQFAMRDRLLNQRLFMWCTAIPLLAVMTYLSVVWAGNWLKYPQLPLVARLPLLLPALLQLSILVWFLNRLMRVRLALKTENVLPGMAASPRRPILRAPDLYVLPAVVSVCLFTLAITGAVIAFKLPVRQDLESFRTTSFLGATIFLVLSLIWPVRVLLRKVRTGSLWLSQAEVEKSRVPKPLWRRILNASAWCAIAVFVTVESGKVPRTMTSWVMVFFFWFAAVVWIADVFRSGMTGRSKEDAAQQSIPETGENP
jgi:hypothetical protein